MNWLPFIGGFAVGTIMTLAVLFVGARFAGDRLDQLSDEHADWRGIGAFQGFHNQPNSQKGPADHA